VAGRSGTSPGGRMEICTTGPGFQLDKSSRTSAIAAASPPVEPLRTRLEAELTPIVNPRPRVKTMKKASSAPPSGNGVPSEPATVT
jgi:glyoxalase family protein